MHWQDLNDSPIKKYWKHGRAWFVRFSFCWCLPTQDYHFSFGVNGGDSYDKLTFSFACGLFAMWLSFRFHRFHFGKLSCYSDKPIFLHEERKFNVSIHDGSIWLMAWGDPMGEWSRDMAWWKYSRSFNPMDFFFGTNKYSTKSLEEGNCLIPMPEGCYEGNYNLFVSTWERPRWPFKKQWKRITINVEKGIPHEGKGENSWDCGEDATYGITCMAENLEDGIGQLVGSCLRDRKRYGGRHLHGNMKSVLATA